MVAGHGNALNVEWPTSHFTGPIFGSAAFFRMPRITPGLWYDYFSGPIFSSTVVTVMLVPGGRTFYVDYLAFETYNTIPDLCTLILVGDGVPLLGLTSDRFSTQQFFPRPIILTNALTMQPLGTLDATKNMLVTFVGQML